MAIQMTIPTLISIICAIFGSILKKPFSPSTGNHTSSARFPNQSVLSLQIDGLQEAATRIMGEGHTFNVIYLDFTKAFDSVNHRFLLEKMMFFRLDTIVVRRIEAYFSGRVS